MMEETYTILRAYYSERGFTTEEEIFRSYSVDDRSNYRNEYDGFDPYEEDTELIAFFDECKYLYG